MITIKTKKKRAGKIEIDLTAPKGNAYYLLGIANKMAIQLGKDNNDILNRMRSGNYENLLMVFEEEFGDFITLYR